MQVAWRGSLESLKQLEKQLQGPLAYICIYVSESTRETRVRTLDEVLDAGRAGLLLSCS